MEAFYGALRLSSLLRLSFSGPREGKNEGAPRSIQRLRNARYTGGEGGGEESWPPPIRPVAFVIVRRSLFARTLRRNIAILRKFDRFCRRRR